MTKLIRSVFLFIAAGVIVSACQTRNDQTHEGEWLRGDMTGVIAEIENQFAGFSQTMWETGYRYQELYWAGRDSNWDYADYQLEHILEALEQGFVRRPEREASSMQFVNQASPALLQAIIAGDRNDFQDQFEALTRSCNTCHSMEQVEFITVAIPEERHSPVRY